MPRRSSPFAGRSTIFGNMEYELGQGIRTEDRLSRLFLNARLDVSRYVDVTGFFSSGRGLGFPQLCPRPLPGPSAPGQGSRAVFLQRAVWGQGGDQTREEPETARVPAGEPAEGPGHIQSHLEAGRFGHRHHEERRLRLRGLLLQSGQPVGIRFLLSVAEPDFRAGILLSSPSPIPTTACGSCPRAGNPQIIHLDGYKTISANVFVPLTRRLSISAEYSYFLQKNANEHQFFVRLLFRK